ncbi:MAG: Unknown protein [uncultured Thiotrichaceae bacterium]|uniref:Uncharacterized protein n=1 Tax=uncultured Thiotrichaceae bacterium TaxID=298394 RepID=A0A6S6SNR9_9GAMM|nr:MAG: Unknown protein [uncultured Thiotrichaceae bacterium]
MNTVAENPSKDVLQQEYSQDEQQLVRQTENVMTSGAPDDAADPNQSLDLVRKILFGEQVKQTEKRQASLERYIQASVASLNEETCKKIDTLKSEISVLTDLFEEETQTRKTNLAGTQENIERVEHSIDKLGHQVMKNHSELNERLGAEKNRLDVQMRDWRQEILQQLQDATQVLGHEKADRQSIAVLLTEMAEQLVTDESVAG